MAFKYKTLSNSLSIKVVLSIGMDVTFNNVIMELAETLNTLYITFTAILNYLKMATTYLNRALCKIKKGNEIKVTNPCDTNIPFHS